LFRIYLGIKFALTSIYTFGKRLCTHLHRFQVIESHVMFLFISPLLVIVYMRLFLSGVCVRNVFYFLFRNRRLSSLGRIWVL